MTVKKLLKKMKKQAKKKGILDREIWETSSHVRCKNVILVSSQRGKEPGTGLDFYEMGFEHGDGKPIKVICKKY